MKSLKNNYRDYSYKDHKEKSFAKEYDIIRAMIDARLSQNITQKKLVARTWITQADISRIENGTRNSSLSMMKRLAQGLGMQLKLEFMPMHVKK